MTHDRRRVKAGTSKASAADRRIAFVDAYLSNNCNATQAAIAVGYSPVNARRQGYRLVTDVHITALLDKKRAEIAASTGLNTEAIIREIGRLCISDVRKLVDKNGQTLLPHELDADTAAAISSFEVGFDGSVKYKFADKGSALEKAAKILGLYETDNRQKVDPITVLLTRIQGNTLRPVSDS